MLAAVGMAVLMRMLVNKENIGWLFIGFLLNKYFGLPAVPIAIIAVVVALAIGFIEKKIFDVRQLLTSGSAAAIDEEEVFFNE